MRVLVCGGRDFDNVAFVCMALNRLHAEAPITDLMQGGAKGVDGIAAEWARHKHGVNSWVCRADWEKHGRAAGPIRNARMLEWKPDFVLAFPGGRGTADMVARAREAAIPVVEAVKMPLAELRPVA